MCKYFKTNIIFSLNKRYRIFGFFLISLFVYFLTFLKVNSSVHTTCSPISLHKWLVKYLFFDNIKNNLISSSSAILWFSLLSHSFWRVAIPKNDWSLKCVFAKNERGYRLTAKKKSLLIATNLTSICCVYEEKIVKKTYTEERSVHTNSD